MNIDKLEAAKAFARDNLPNLAQELLDWQNTGCLVAHDAKLRELAKMFDFVPGHHNRLTLAESTIHNAALEAIVGFLPSAAPTDLPTIKVGITNALVVRFIKQIFEDDFPEKGMTALLTDVVWNDHVECYKLFFDFTAFEQENLPYFKAVYFPNRHTAHLEAETGRSLFTAIETGNYTPKYSAYFSLSSNTRDDALFEKEIEQYLQVME